MVRFQHQISVVKFGHAAARPVEPWMLPPQPDQFLMTRRYTTDAYVPFGAGPRACAGMGVAMLELQLLALEMAAAYRFTGVSPNPAPWPKAWST